MNNTARNLLITSGFALALSSAVNGLGVDADVDINTRTEYANCQKYADRIVELVQEYVRASSNSDRAHYAKKIKRQKKKLRQCEKDNKNWHKTMVVAVTGGKAGLSYRF